MGLLILLGFSTIGCERIGRLEYGTPTAEYSIKGKVTDASQSGTGISGIRMVFIGNPEYAQFHSDTVYTASNGTYYYQNRNVRLGLSGVVLNDPNGNFKSDTVQITFTPNESKRNGNWVTVYTKNNADFTLQPSQDPEPEFQIFENE